MSSKSPAAQQIDLDDPALGQADAAAVLEQFISGATVDPAIADRVRARAERLTQDIRRAHGLLDDDAFQSLLDDEA